jgi:Flp pilus assembly protein TadB
MQEGIAILLAAAACAYTVFAQEDRNEHGLKESSLWSRSALKTRNECRFVLRRSAAQLRRLQITSAKGLTQAVPDITIYPWVATCRPICLAVARL